MSFIDDFSDMMTYTVTRKAYLEHDAYGKPSHTASATTYKSRYVKKTKKVRDLQGQEVVSTAQLWLQGNPDVSPEDLITLEDGTTPIIANIERFQDEEGWSHTVVFFL